MTKRALITGITGQDGSYLAELLLEKGYEVHGLVRRSSHSNTQRIHHLLSDAAIFEKTLFLHDGDLTDAGSIKDCVGDVEPDEIYNLGAQSHVRISFDTPAYTVDVVANGTLRVLEAARDLAQRKEVRFYQASSSEMYGRAVESPQTELTPFYPRSPYAAAKVFAFHQTVIHRESYGLYACNGVLFNHESPRRGDNFVTRKITQAAARIAAGLQDTLALGNTTAERDWGYAKEYVEGIWRMLQQDEPGDYVLATGETNSVQTFLELAFESVGLNAADHVVTDERFLRPNEVDVLRGDPSKARDVLGWEAKVKLRELVQIMVAADVAQAERESNEKQSGTP